MIANVHVATTLITRCSLKRMEAHGTTVASTA